MYLEHFGLTEEPFSVTSDPRFLFLSESHEEALAHLIYCVEYRKGFAAITGEIGTGKTTLLNTLISRLDQRTSVAFVYQSASTTVELMRYVFKDLGLKVVDTDRTGYLNQFNDFLVSEHELGRDVVLVVDEAQNLAIEVLEDLRLISNFESGNRKLVQIILAGQTELGVKLRLPELRQLNQRIAIQYVLKALAPTETGSYIQHRLKTAGSSQLDIFRPGAIKVIQQVSGGVPRLINQLCDTALVRAAFQHKSVVDPQLVRAVIREEFQFRGPSAESVSARTSIGRTWNRTAIWLIGILLFAGALGLGWSLGRGGRVTGADSLAELPQHEPASALDSGSSAVAEPDGAISSRTSEAGASTGTLADRLPAKQSDRPVKVAERTRQVTPQATQVTHRSRGNGDSESSAVRRVQVRPGDRLSALVEKSYGFVTWELLLEVQQSNPRITDPNLILAGEWIVLPDLKDSTLQRLRLGRPL